MYLTVESNDGSRRIGRTTPLVYDAARCHQRLSHTRHMSQLAGLSSTRATGYSRRCHPMNFRRLAPHLTEAPLTLKQSLSKADRPIRHVCFPDSGVCSVMSVMQSGKTAEVGTVGNEGVTGLAVFFGDVSEPSESMIQVPGTGHLLSANVFTRELAFKLTHEFLGMMSGASRPHVTLVARKLQDAGLIAYRHGQVTVRDRRKLEAGSCECYGIVSTYFNYFLRRLAQ